MSTKLKKHRSSLLISVAFASTALSVATIGTTIPLHSAYAQGATCGTFAGGAIVQPAQGNTNGNAGNTACGVGAVAGPATAFVFGSTAMGFLAQATGEQATAIGGSSIAGDPALALADRATAVGGRNIASGVDSSAVGSTNTASGLEGSAFGFRNVAQGDFSTALGAANNATELRGTAVGALNTAGTQATAVGFANAATGANSTALGSASQALGNSSVAIGDTARATGTNAIAIGTGAVATGSVAVGAGASAANGGAAFGDAAIATGTNATAVGPGASATFANSSAIGTGASTTAANQMALGTASNTYRMPGITSAASLAAQSGPTSFVTTDANGNLAATSLSVPNISNLTANVAALQQGFNTLQYDLQQGLHKANTGTAIALALGGMANLQPGRRFALSGGWGNFQGNNALGVGATALVYDSKSYAVVANAGVGFGVDTNVVGTRGVVSLQW